MKFILSALLMVASFSSVFANHEVSPLENTLLTKVLAKEELAPITVEVKTSCGKTATITYPEGSNPTANDIVTDAQRVDEALCPTRGGGSLGG